MKRERKGKRMEAEKMQSISWHLKRNGKFSVINSHYPAVIWIVHIANGIKCGFSKHEFYQRFHRHFLNAFQIQILQFLNRNSNILMLRQANAVQIRHVSIHIEKNCRSVRKLLRGRKNENDEGRWKEIKETSCFKKAVSDCFFPFFPIVK